MFVLFWTDIWYCEAQKFLTQNWLEFGIRNFEPPRFVGDSSAKEEGRFGDEQPHIEERWIPASHPLEN